MGGRIVFKIDKQLCEDVDEAAAACGDEDRDEGIIEFFHLNVIQRG